MPQDTTHIVILGGGFGGVYCAQALYKAMRRSERKRVVVSLVSQENYIVFQPLLPEVVSGSIEPLTPISPIRRLAPHAHLYVRHVDAIDLETNTVRLEPGYLHRPLELRYDHLVIALGNRLAAEKVPGMTEHAIPFKYLRDALWLRNHLVHVLEEADFVADERLRRQLLTFVVAGGGFSGVECIAELNDFVRTASRHYPHVNPADFKVILLQSAERILPELHAHLGEFAHRVLTHRGVDIRLNARLTAVTPDTVFYTDKTTGQTVAIPTRTCVATVPSGPHPMVTALPCVFEHGRIKVGNDLLAEGRTNVWAVGDCAAVPQKDGIYSPATAQHAIRQATCCARNIVAQMRGEPRRPFTFTGLGTLGSLGHRSAVADLMGFRVSGVLAWILWRTIYLMKMPGLDRKLRVGLDWFFDLILPREITQVRIFQDEAVGQEHYESGQVIFDQGDVPDKTYFIIKGEVEVRRDGQSVTTIGAGDVFGEVALVSDCPRNASIVARTPLDVITVSRSAFFKLFVHLPGIKHSFGEVLEGKVKDLFESRQSSPPPSST